ncbi:MAG: molybdopterin-dependent oxidoreductase [Spirochaetaceae bacterium]
MTKAEHLKLIYSGKYILPLDTVTKKSYKILIYRSTINSGSIDLMELPELPENYSIIKSEDLKSKKTFMINDYRIPVLANKTVNYLGEPVLLIVGPAINTLKEIYKAIKIDYTETEPEPETEIFFEKKLHQGDENSITEAYKVLSGIIKTPNRVVKSSFLHGSFTKRESDSFLVYSSGIWESKLRDNIAAICNLDSNRVKIITPITTGEDESFVYDSFKSAIFTSVTASIIKKNVSYVPTPEDQYIYSEKSYGLKANWKLAFDENSKLLALKVEVILNCGAYPIFAKEKVLRILHGITSFYRFKNVEISVKAVKSNNPPGGIAKSLYLSDALYISEMLVSKIIQETSSDQFLWRYDNLLRKGFKNSSGAIIKRDLPLNIMLKNVVTQSDFSRKNSSFNLSLLRPANRIHHTSKRGIGISVGYNGNSFLSNNKEISTNGITLQLDKNGKVELTVSCRVCNLSILTIWEDLIAEVLNIEHKNIVIISEDSWLVDDSGPNIENKNVTILTPLIKQCCEELNDRRFKDPLPLRQTKTTRRTSMAIWNQDVWKGIPFKSSSYAACAIEIEIDKRDLSCIIKQLWIELEVGQILHKPSLISAIHREIKSTINWLQGSEPGTQNNLFSALDHYNNPTIQASPKINIGIYETGKNKNIPKGVGSLIKNTIPGAYLQSVNQALGSHINSFPITKDMIYRELKKDEI